MIDARLPFISRPKCQKYFVAAVSQSAAKVDYMLFAAAKVDSRRNVQDTHRPKITTFRERKKRHASEEACRKYVFPWEKLEVEPSA